MHSAFNRCGVIPDHRLKKQNGEKVHLKPGPTVLDTMVVDIELTAVEDIENDKEESAVISDIQGTIYSIIVILTSAFLLQSDRCDPQAEHSHCHIWRARINIAHKEK